IQTLRKLPTQLPSTKAANHHSQGGTATRLVEIVRILVPEVHSAWRRGAAYAPATAAGIRRLGIVASRARWRGGGPARAPLVVRGAAGRGLGVEEGGGGGGGPPLFLRLCPRGGVGLGNKR